MPSHDGAARMKLPLGLPALIFSIKSFAAAVLALWIAFHIGLPNPYWALVTVYVVAQPRVGAVLSKSVYRIVGTMTGAIVSVALVPPLVDAPEILSLAIALWLGLCVFASGIERSPRSYMFALAGYSTCIIVFASVQNPGAIFDTAVARFEEITLGILCSSMIHATVLPGSARELMLSKLDATMQTAARWSADALVMPGDCQLDRDRCRLASDVNEIHELLVHSGFEGAGMPLRRDVVRALLAQVERTLPLSAGVDDRLSELARLGGASHGVEPLVSDIEQWLRQIADGAPHTPGLLSAADALRRRCREAEPAVVPGMGWRERLELSLLARLADLIQVNGNALLLRKAMRGDRQRDSERRRIRVLVAGAQRSVERDVAGAAGAAIATAATLYLICLLWIASGWEGGVNGVMLAGVYFSIYANNSDPSLLLRNKFIGVALRLLLGAAYVLIVLPAIDGLPLFVLALAPVLILCGALQTVPRYAPLSFNFIIGTLSPNIISERFEPAFADYLNGGLSTLTGIYLALVAMNLTQSLWTSGAVARTLKAGQHDIALGRFGAGSAAAWRSRMLHRIALITPRLARDESDGTGTTRDVLRDMMAGLSLAQLAGLHARLEPGGGSGDQRHSFFREELFRPSRPWSIAQALGGPLENDRSGIRRRRCGGSSHTSPRRRIGAAKPSPEPFPGCSSA